VLVKYDISLDQPLMSFSHAR